MNEKSLLSRFQGRRAMIVFILGAAVWFLGFSDVLERATKPYYDTFAYKLYPHDEAVLNGSIIENKDLFIAAPPEADFTIVTSASRAYFDRLLNLIGSIHLYEPNVRIVVFDLHLSRRQRDYLGCLHNVEVRDMNLDDYPPHVRVLSNYAWKTILLSRLANLFPNGVMYLDSGSEIWKALDEVRAFLKRDGYFFTIQGTKLNLTHPATAKFLGAEAKVEELADMNHISSGFVGFMLNSIAPGSEQEEKLQTVLGELRRCGEHMECISPRGADLTNHKFDQSVLTLLVAGNFTYHHEWRWWADFWSIQDNREVYWGGPVQFFSRRYHCPKPHLGYLLWREGCSRYENPSFLDSLLLQLDSSGDPRMHERTAWRCPEKLSVHYIIIYWIILCIISIYIAIPKRDKAQQNLIKKIRASLCNKRRD